MVVFMVVVVEAERGLAEMEAATGRRRRGHCSTTSSIRRYQNSGRSTTAGWPTRWRRSGPCCSRSESWCL